MIDQSMKPALLRVEHLTHRFGGLTAVRDVSLACRAGEVHAVIGPNGAGKSTLVNLVGGQLRPSAGRVFLDGEEVTGLPPARMARRGVGRSYQKTNLFPPLTAFEHCRLAAQAATRHGPAAIADLLRLPASLAAAGEAAERALAAAGLQGRAARTAATLSHGEQRQLEIAMALAAGPRLLLLDEPLAGMGAEESARIVELIARIAPDHAVLLIEHDMDAVFALANVLTVMVEGTVLESGPPETIRSSRAVQEAYLGTEDLLA